VLRSEPQYTPPTERDREVFEALVPADHYLRRVAQAVDFERFRPLMASQYSAAWGRPAKEPVLLLKLEFLQYEDRLSDRQVIEQAQVNIAYREFLGLGLASDLPDPSLLSRFRGRLGADGHRQVFDDMVAQAREQGVIRDRLRLKDATHVIANVAVPATIRLVAAMRQRLLAAVAAYDPERAEGERMRAETIRGADSGASREQRLEMRVTHLREILAWAEELWEQRREEIASGGARGTRLVEAVQLARKILADREDPEAGDRTVSLADPDTRFGFHHGSYCGYSLDVLMDADSEFVTTLDVLPANGDEAADAAALVRQEEQTHGNDVQALSGDSALFQGEELRELSDPDGLALEVFVPPIKPRQTKYFTPEEFSLDETGATLRCPAGQVATFRGRNCRDTGWVYRFRRDDCAACPLLEKCMPKLPKEQGRAVNKGEYVAEYAAARAKALTAEYAAVRKTHRKVERKLGEIMRHHGGRRARCRGRPKVLIQELMATLAVNVRRLVQILRAPAACPATA
jgi:transposase